MKKFFAILMTLSLMLSLVVPASAAHVIAPEGHSYDAYQIFSGTQGAASTALGDVAWGTGIKDATEDNSATFLEALQSDDRFKVNDVNIFVDDETAADVAETLAANNADAIAKAFANVAAQHLTDTCTRVEESTQLASGYYLLNDVTNVDNTQDARNSALLQVTDADGEIQITKKYTTPSVTKKVTDVNDSTGVTTDLQDSADYDIGDKVPFTLTGTLPSNLSDYETYKYVFHDTLSTGLTYNGDAKVYLNSVDGANDITSHFTIAPDTATTTGGGSLTISIDNIKSISGVTSSSNIIVVYTATLNSSAEIGMPGNPNTVTLEFSNDPDYDGDGIPPTGTTPEDKAVVFTYKVIVNKKDGSNDNTALAGAAFKLEKKVSGVWTLIKEFTITDDNKLSVFEFTGLDDGDYKLTETVTPAGYNSIDPIEFTISATHDSESANPTLSNLTGLAKDNVLTFTADLSAGSLAADVINNAGSTLPETGGMGTTIFYIVGGIMVVGAVVLLITKKRMSAEG